MHAHKDWVGWGIINRIDVYMCMWGRGLAAPKDLRRQPPDARAVTQLASVRSSAADLPPVLRYGGVGRGAGPTGCVRRQPEPSPGTRALYLRRHGQARHSYPG